MEILTYRAIPKGDNEFIYGIVFKMKQGKIERFFIVPSKMPAILNKIESPIYRLITHIIEVKKDTIGRYTGYRESAFERDRKIYEGDIVEGKLFDEKFVGIVEINEFNTAVFYPILHVSPEGKIKTIPKKDRFEEPLDMLCCISIIGNIHIKKILTPKKYKEYIKEVENEK